ncbi:hypothetical protein DDZ14_03565 [Maritimibacter sp. 55A14]|uniref:5-bromo-4-chloroindolyl phosphate hydrolysis family protein n=1 Tax=Maritimibacter sp. 55A14 TaxID=2174844 RepID=UPI000D619145|nr:5-bromo-4-chloroindolyl phosphate hydrolysis family protein [Maritimibacter sp. 55A14]PWE33753.1 hypothetical protein DDZ14_03565 [Maritimibacter sp. 55A14]
MAQRYGGQFSPGAERAEESAPARPLKGQRVPRAGARVNLLFLAPLPLLFTAFGAGPAGMAVDLAAFGTLVLAAWLLREGLRAEDVYDARKVARRPAIPRKIFASVLTGAGIFLAAWQTGGAVIGPAIYALIGAGLHLLSFGIDPLRNKGMDGFDAHAGDRVARAVDEAEAHLRAMRTAIAGLGDRALEDRVERFQATARDMFRTVEQDPRDLTAARRYLGVYLIGARDAAQKLSELRARNPAPEDRADFVALLDDLEANFQTRTKALMADNRTDFEVEIEVLRERLAREGVRPQK